MIIAVDTRYLVQGPFNNPSFFSADQLMNLVAALPEHRFVLIRNTHAAPLTGLPANAAEVHAGPATTNSLLLQYWYNYKLPVVLRKQQAALFLAADGIASLHTRIPQCLFVHDTSFIDTPAFFTGRHFRFYRKNMASFLEKASTIITHSEYSRTVLLTKYPLITNKAVSLPVYADPVFCIPSDAEKEATKNRHTDGKEFFLAVTSGHANDNLLNLLKAFSFFKKRQKSNMQLIIVGNPARSFLEDLRTYKFRNDVQVLTNLSEAERAAITAAAYALVYPVLHDEKGQVLTEAMQCGVPVIASDTGALRELMGDAGLTANPAVFEDMAQNMMLLFKDEDLVQQLRQKGLEQIRSRNKSNTVNLFNQLLKKAVNG